MVRKLVQLASKSHHENVLASLNQMRLQGQLCDATVHVDFQGDVKEFQAHQVVLAAASGYFSRILLSQDEAQDTIQLSDVDSKMFSVFLDFVYMGKTSVVGSKIPDVQAIAQLLECRDLWDVCDEAMDAAIVETPKKKTAESNVVDHYYLKSKKKAKGARGKRQVAKLVLKRTLPPQSSEKEEAASKRAKVEDTGIKDKTGDGPVNKRNASLRIHRRSLDVIREEDENQVTNEDVEEGVMNVEVHSQEETEISAVPAGDDWGDWEPDEETNDLGTLMFSSEEGEREGDGEVKVKSKSSSKAQFQCDKCQRTFHYERSYLKHISTYHGVKADITYCCETCQQTFANRSNLKIHEKHVHSNERLFSCSSCSKNFKRKKDVVRHQRQVHEHSTLRHICPECGKSLSSKTALLLHQRIHTGEKPFECTECGSKFTQNAALKMHCRIHTGEKPHECDECDARFSQKHMLVYHKRSHTGEKPFMCEACGKSFASKEYLRHHSNIHSGFKPYKCEQCGRGFAQRNSLHQHLKIHTGERPYACKDCDKQFTQINALQRHQRIHTGEKPFMCSLCNRTFTDKSTLRRHAMTHDADTPWRTYLVVLEGNVENKKSKSPARGKTQKAGEKKTSRKSGGEAGEAGSADAAADGVVAAVDATSADDAAASKTTTDTTAAPEQPVTISSEWSSPGTITLVSHTGLEGIAVIHTKAPPASHVQPIVTSVDAGTNVISLGGTTVPVAFSAPSEARPIPLSPEASSTSLSVPSLTPVSEVPAASESSVLEAAASQTILVPDSETNISNDINIVIVPDIQTVVVSDKDCGMEEVGEEQAEKPPDELEKAPDDNNV